MTKYYLRGFGAYTPERILTNIDLEQLVETSDEWITTRTGIKQRHISDGDPTSTLAAGAAEAAIADAKIERENVSHLIVASCTPDAYCPNTACIVEHKLGLKGLMALDINAACSGFLYGLSLARSILCAEKNANVIVSGAETMSTRTNWEDRNTCVLFGDGAGAVIASTDSGEGSAELIDVKLSSDGSLAELLTIKGGGSSHPYKLGEQVPEEHFIMMQGREVFKHAVRSMSGICEEVLKNNGLTTEDVDLLIPHQANIRIIEAVGKKLHIPVEKVFVNVDLYGNTSAASIPLAIADARKQGVIKPGMRVLLTTFGGGFTWGSALLKF